MKTYLRDKRKPKNLEELKDGIRTYWKMLTPEVCARYIDHLQKVIPAVVQEEGGPSATEQFDMCVTYCLHVHLRILLTMQRYNYFFMYVHLNRFA